MGYRINRKVVINNRLKWIHANTEQDYADKIIMIAMIPQTMENSETVQKHIFGEYARTWFSLYSEPNIETVTAITYKRQIEKVLIPALGKMYIEDITTDQIQELFNSMAGTKSTKDKVKIVLNQILNAAVEDGIINKSPLKSSRLKINGESSKETKPYSVEQMQYIVQHIGEVKKENDRILISMLALHPLRLEEVLGLRFEDFDFERMQFTVNRAVTHPKRNKPEIKDTKTESSHRTLTLSSIAADIIAEVGHKQGFILGGECPYSYTQVRKACERIKKDIK